MGKNAISIINKQLLMDDIGQFFFGINLLIRPVTHNKESNGEYHEDKESAKMLSPKEL